MTPTLDTPEGREAVLRHVQLGSAAVLAVCVVIHLAFIVYAVREGLSTLTILGRVRGAGAWLAFYMTFVTAAAVHAPLGLRAVIADWRACHSRNGDLIALAFAALLFVTGMRAVYAMVIG